MNNSHKKPSQWRAFLALAYYSLRAQTRNPATFFFGFIFPIVFISIFGLIGNNPTKLMVGLSDGSSQNNPILSSLESLEVLTLERNELPELQKKLSEGTIVGIVEVDEVRDETYEVQLWLSAGQPQEAAIVRSLVRNSVDTVNLELSGITEPPIMLVDQEVSGRKPRYIDFAVPGQIGFALLSTAIFGTVFGLIYLKKALILKRMFATPTQALTILLAQGASRLVVAIAQTVLILFVTVFVFHFYLPHGVITFIELLAISALGLIAFLGFGYFIAGLTNDENAASPLTNLVTLPQFLLSGTFFPTESFPGWLQPIANNLPLSYFNHAVRHITTGGTLIETWPFLAGLLAWGAVMYVLAAKTFKWE